MLAIPQSMVLIIVCLGKHLPFHCHPLAAEQSLSKTDIVEQLLLCNYIVSSLTMLPIQYINFLTQQNVSAQIKHQSSVVLSVFLIFGCSLSARGHKVPTYNYTGLFLSEG